MTERINKVLARLGHGSRRACDGLIASGAVRVNNKLAKLGQQVSDNDEITVNKQAVNRTTQKVILLKFHKPAGVATTKKDRFEPVTVMDFLPPKYQHLYPVGRLDKPSRGLLLFTNDGQLTLHLTHPKYEHEKEYVVQFVSVKKRTPSDVHADLNLLKNTVIDDAAQSKPIQIKNPVFDDTKQAGSVTIILTEGKNRQIRRLFQTLGYFVTDLERVRIGKLRLGGLKPGTYSEISPKDL